MRYIAATQNGTLTKNTPRQLRYSEKVPPTNGPSAWPSADTPSTKPMARAWRVPLNALDTTAIDTGKMSAAPTPCTTRAMMRNHSSGALPQMIDTMPKTASPMTITSRRPKMSASRPAVTMSAPTDSM